MDVIGRSAWGARYRAGFGARALPTAECWLHHSVTLAPDLAFRDLNADSRDDDEVAAMRSIERVGQERFGAGFSYNLAVMPSGRVYEGCGVARVGAHTAGRNTRSMGVVLVGNYQDHRLPAPMEAAVPRLLQHAHRAGWIDRPAFDGGHRDLKQTACPGQHAYALLRSFNDRAAGVLPPPEQEDDDMPVLGPGTARSVVLLIQTCLVNEAKASGRLGGNPLPRFGVDGHYGEETKHAVAAYQAGKVPATGLVDGVTAALLFRWEHPR